MFVHPHSHIYLVRRPPGAPIPMPGHALLEAGWRLHWHITAPMPGNEASTFGRFAVDSAEGKVQIQPTKSVTAIQSGNAGHFHTTNDGWPSQTFYLKISVFIADRGRTVQAAGRRLPGRLVDRNSEHAGDQLLLSLLLHRFLAVAQRSGGSPVAAVDRHLCPELAAGLSNIDLLGWLQTGRGGCQTTAETQGAPVDQTSRMMEMEFQLHSLEQNNLQFYVINLFCMFIYHLLCCLF
jgi:hypothetical protein